MKLGICNETFQDWPLEKAFEYAACAGYSGIEIAPFTLANHAASVTPYERANIRRLAEKHGLEVIGLHWLLAATNGLYLTSPEKTTQDKTTEYIRDLCRLCNDLGGKVMVLGSPKQRNLLPGVSESQAMEIAASVLSGAADTLAFHDVTLALEPLGAEEGDFLNTAEQAIELAKLVDHSHVKLHLDVKAMSSEDKSITDIIHDSRDWLAHFHANDANRRGPGMGDIDFKPILTALSDIGYDDWVSVEVFDYDPGIECLVDESIRYLNNTLEEIRLGD